MPCKSTRHSGRSCRPGDPQPRPGGVALPRRDHAGTRLVGRTRLPAHRLHTWPSFAPAGSPYCAYVDEGGRGRVYDLYRALALALLDELFVAFGPADFHLVFTLNRYWTTPTSKRCARTAADAPGQAAGPPLLVAEQRNMGVADGRQVGVEEQQVLAARTGDSLVAGRTDSVAALRCRAVTRSSSRACRSMIAPHPSGESSSTATTSRSTPAWRRTDHGHSSAKASVDHIGTTTLNRVTRPSRAGRPSGARRSPAPRPPRSAPPQPLDAGARPPASRRTWSRARRTLHAAR